MMPSLTVLVVVSTALTSIIATRMFFWSAQRSSAYESMTPSSISMRPRGAWCFESVLPSSVQYQDTLRQVTDYFVAQGNSLLQAQQQAVQWIGQQVQAQASFLAYMDAFWVLMLISLAAVPLALSLRKVKLGGAVHVGH